MKIRSGLTSRASATPIGALEAVTMACPSRPSMTVRISALVGSSSTTKIFRGCFSSICDILTQY
ncbi:hypothetical protein D3C72_2598430 [compost metagenome]